jgi:hypothetical protein
MKHKERNSKIIKRDKNYYGGGSMPRKKKNAPFGRRSKRLLDLTVMERDENASLKTFIRRAKKFGTKFAINSYFKDEDEPTGEEGSNREFT